MPGDVHALLSSAALCNDAAVEGQDLQWTLSGDPTEGALVVAAMKIGIDVESTMVVGDSVWDMLAAQHARALGIGLLSGGYGEDELARAGAYRVFADPAAMLHHLDELGVR